MERFQRRIAPQRRSNPGVIRPIYAGVFDLRQDGFEHARRSVMNWIRTNPAVQRFIGEVGDGQLDAVEEGVRVQCAQSDDATLWVMRLQAPEYDMNAETFDRVRDWRTDITLGRDDDSAWIAARQWFKGVASDVRKCYPPRFIKDLWREQQLSDGLVLSAPPWLIEYPEEIDTLVELIDDTERALPVVALAEGSPLDPGRLATDSIGLAHVCRVPRALRPRFNEVFEAGQELVHGALRTFYPRISERAAIAPAARWQTVVDWKFGDEVGASAFAEWLHAEMARAIVARLLNDSAHRTYEELRGKQIQAKQSALSERAEDNATVLESAQLMQEERELLLLENESLQQQVDELSRRTEDLSGGLSLAQSRFGEERTKTLQLEYRIIGLQHALARKSGSEAVTLSAAEVDDLIEKQRTPKSVFEAVEIADDLFRTFSRPVTFADRALETAMDSPFVRPRDALAALLRLGFLWSEVDSGNRREQRARELLQVPVTMHESQTSMTKHGDERKVITPAGEEVTLEKHIRLGGGPQNDRPTLSIYFGDRDGKILVGIVGRHPTTAKTQ